MRLPRRAGLVGCSIEDATGDKERPLYDFDHGGERIKAAVAAARARRFPSPSPRAPRASCAATLISMKSSAACKPSKPPAPMCSLRPACPTSSPCAACARPLTKPVNFMVGIKGKSFSVAELQAAGVRRISLATSLFRAAMTGLLDAAREVKERGTFGYLERTLATPDINRYMQ